MNAGIYKTLIKTDKHGNKTFLTNKCRKCNGVGKIVGYAMDHGRCWRCMGTGIESEYKTVELTEEQRITRREKAEAKKAGTEAQQLHALGFNELGIGYTPIVDSFQQKDAIKKIGGQWDWVHRRWIMPVKPDFIECAEIYAKDETFTEILGLYIKYPHVWWKNLN